MTDGQPRNRVLAIFPGALGDLICVAPALCEIARRSPGTTPELMARAELAKFATGRIAGIARGHSIDRPEVAALFGDAPDARAREFFAQFAQVHSFFAANHDGYRRALTEATAGAANFYAFRSDGAGHIAELYLREIGATSTTPDFVLHLLDSDLANARAILDSLGVSPREFVLIFPGSGSQRKNWPAENFAALAKLIVTPLAPMVVLGPAEEKLSTDAPTLAGLDLGTVAGLARLSTCFVGNDSGISHLAAAAGTCGIALFGATDPARWRPRGAVTVIACQPIDSISVTEVHRALTALISD